MFIVLLHALSTIIIINKLVIGLQFTVCFSKDEILTCLFSYSQIQFPITFNSLFIDYTETVYIEDFIMVFLTTYAGNFEVSLLGDSPHNEAFGFCDYQDSEISEETTFSCDAMTRVLKVIPTLKDLILNGFITYYTRTYIDKYVGCFMLTPDLRVDNDFDKPGLCINYCRSKDFHFAGMSIRRCHCTSQIRNLMQVSIASCSRRCHGGLCGGEDLSSIYSTDSRVYKITSECANNRAFCKRCSSGYFGINCTRRDCDVNHGGCGDEICEDLILENAQKLGFCLCRDGYTLTESGKCVDIDECTFTCNLATELCVNLPGEYKCVCKEGFYRPSSDKECQDSDECLELNPCSSANSSCVNEIGSYICKCPGGYEVVDSRFCFDIDECLNENSCNLATSICKNQMGSFWCECLVGFQIHKYMDCIDIDECLNISYCQRNVSRCVNSIGSFTCHCLDGYLQSGMLCTDIDECENTLACDIETSICENALGYYVCKCFMGFERISDKKCKDLDECNKIGKCELNSTTCVNKVGSYQCVCLMGFEFLTTSKCKDIDECLEGSHTCEKFAECNNIVGSFTCHCGQGFIIEIFDYAQKCVDIDECKYDISCDIRSSVCINLQGGFACTCLPGFTKVNESCDVATSLTALTTEMTDDYTGYTEVPAGPIIEFMWIVMWMTLGIIVLIIVANLVAAIIIIYQHFKIGPLSSETETSYVASVFVPN